MLISRLGDRVPCGTWAGPHISSCLRIRSGIIRVRSSLFRPAEYVTESLRVMETSGVGIADNDLGRRFSCCQAMFLIDQSSHHRHGKRYAFAFLSLTYCFKSILLFDHVVSLCETESQSVISSLYFLRLVCEEQRSFISWTAGCSYSQQI